MIGDIEFIWFIDLEHVQFFVKIIKAFKRWLFDIFGKARPSSFVFSPVSLF